MIGAALRAARRAAVRHLGLRIRPEPWGGIVLSERPAALFYVDRELLRGLGHPEAAAWAGPPPPRPAGHHRAPVEVHWTLSRRCDQACPACYTHSVPDAPPLDPARIETIADALAAAGVFHVAIGGGEPLADPSILQVAAALRRRGIAPSTTTSGAPVTPELAARLGDFAQVNVSIDGVGADYARVRGADRFAMADAALGLLQRHVPRVGINAVLTRDTFPGLDRLVAYARRRRATELEILRLKPAGRGRAAYLARRLTPEQGEALLPRVLELAKRHRVRLKLDCSFAPFVYAHHPHPDVVRFFRIVGCEAGDSLASLDSRGAVTGCSFLAPRAGTADRVLGSGYPQDPVLARYRRWRDAAPAPCGGCAYLDVCNGGCRAVSAFLTGDELAPDPECPAVRRHHGPTLPPEPAGC